MLRHTQPTTTTLNTYTSLSLLRMTSGLTIDRNLFTKIATVLVAVVVTAAAEGDNGLNNRLESEEFESSVRSDDEILLHIYDKCWVCAHWPSMSPRCITRRVVSVLHCHLTWKLDAALSAEV